VEKLIEIVIRKAIRSKGEGSFFLTPLGLKGTRTVLFLGGKVAIYQADTM
jgi:hypothetical protein